MFCRNVTGIPYLIDFEHYQYVPAWLSKCLGEVDLELSLLDQIKNCRTKIHIFSNIAIPDAEFVILSEGTIEAYKVCREMQDQGFRLARPTGVLK